MALSRGSILAALLAAAAVAVAQLVGYAAAADYIVGDSIGWQIPPGGASDYANWASRHVFRVGDVLVFNFTTGAHDVAHVTKAAFGQCTISNPSSLINAGPARVTLNSTGEEHYICTIGRHCDMGQKLAINVTAASSSPTPSPPSSGGLSPPPPPNSTATITSYTPIVVLVSSLVYGLVVS